MSNLEKVVYSILVVVVVVVIGYFIGMVIHERDRKMMEYHEAAMSKCGEHDIAALDCYEWYGRTYFPPMG